VKLFVYGTLRRGQAAHDLLRGAVFVARVTTEPRFRLVDFDGYPALVECGTTAVVGEIYELDETLLAELDRYEDAPALYERVAREIGGHEVFVYLLPEERAVGRLELRGGDFCAQR
jgi:gamma-glutamylcyclotransferase (GGCT)/AIG2-like uncharacterized protein YtfP